MYGFKRMLDIVLTVPAIVILSPILLILIIISCLQIGRPIFFRQLRPGKDGHPFVLYKFRTMTNDKDISGDLLPDGRRITRLGCFLRSTSLDELPELFNILKGDMSIVGPRPLLTQYLDRYTPQQQRRHEIKPGLTGWAQVNGRNAITWEEKFRLDVWYIDHCDMWLDIKIIIMTIKNVLLQKGISQKDHATMPEFGQ